jgi:hypothetical protein
MKMKLFFLITLFLSFLPVKSQDVSAYVRIEDASFEPIVSIKQGKGEQILSVTSKNEMLNIVLSNAKIKKFEKAFPTVKNKWLKKVYIVVSDDEKLFNNLKQEQFRGVVSDVEIFGEPQPCYTPNDYGLAIRQTNLDLVKAKGAWDIIGNIPRLPMGVSDFYFDTTHPDLQGQFIGVRGSRSVGGHGTAVSSVLSAITDNSIGLASIGFGAKIYASNTTGGREVLRLAEMGYRVINCSWVNYYACSYSDIEDTLYRYIRDDLNTVVVAGAGNTGIYTGCQGKSSKAYPASYSSVLSVTSVGHIYPIEIGHDDCIDCCEGTVGNPQTVMHHNDAVDICAPGFKVPLAALDSGYYSAGGTSFAAPHVAATICLILSINPCLTAGEAANIVKIAADPSIYNLSCNRAYIGRLGAGRLDVEKACMLAAQSATKNFDIPKIFYNDEVVESNYTIKNTSSVTIENGTNIQFKARRDIELKADFEVKSGATFTAEIDPNLKICQ